MAKGLFPYHFADDMNDTYYKRQCPGLFTFNVSQRRHPNQISVSDYQ